MTHEEFYARALIAALPIAVEENQPIRVDRENITAETAHRYAEALTKAYKEYVAKERKKQRSTLPPPSSV